MRSMYPHSIIYRDAFRGYLAACYEKDKFLKSLDVMRYCDWIIHKRLLEERGKRIYTVNGRSNGKQETIDHYLEFLSEGKEVVVTHRKDTPELIKPNKRFRDMFVDKDLYFSNPVNESLAEKLGEYINDEFRKRLMTEPVKLETHNPYLMDWKPIVRSDSYIFDDKRYFLDPVWRFLPDGGIRLMEVSLIPNPEREVVDDEFRQVD